MPASAVRKGFFEARLKALQTQAGEDPMERVRANQSTMKPVP